MTDSQVLEQAIKIAIDGGWWPSKYQEGVSATRLAELWLPIYTQLIYNRDFAKAIWGDSNQTLEFPEGSIHLQDPVWQFHLQQMVISPNPLAYLKDNLPTQEEVVK